MATQGEVIQRQAEIEHFDLLAALFTYPDEAYRAKVLAAAAAFRGATIRERAPGENAQSDETDRPLSTADLVVEFATRTRDMRIEEMQELFIGTFDLNPVCSLEVGWHLFGEDYARGTFLVNMRGELRRLGLRESTELPDHLTHVLPVLARLEGEDAAIFARKWVLPALDKMLQSFEPRDKEKDEQNRDNAYQLLLSAVREAVSAVAGSEPAGKTPALHERVVEPAAMERRHLAGGPPSPDELVTIQSAHGPQGEPHD